MRRLAMPRWYTAQRNLPHGTMDIACFGAVNGYRASDAGLLEPLDETKVPNLKHVLPELRSAAFVPHIYSAQVIVYNPTAVTDPPKSFADLLDPKWNAEVGMVQHGGTLGADGCQLAGNRHDH